MGVWAPKLGLQHIKLVTFPFGKSFHLMHIYLLENFVFKYPSVDETHRGLWLVDENPLIQRAFSFKDCIGASQICKTFKLFNVSSFVAGCR